MNLVDGAIASWSHGGNLYRLFSLCVLAVFLYCKLSDSLIERRRAIYMSCGKTLAVLVYVCAFVVGQSVFYVPLVFLHTAHEGLRGYLSLSLAVLLILFPVACLYARTLWKNREQAKDWRAWASIFVMLLSTSAVAVCVLGPRVVS